MPRLLSKARTIDENPRRYQFGQLPEGEMGLRPAGAALHLGRGRYAEARNPHDAISKAQQRGAGPEVEFDDGRILAESNAIIRYLARGSDLIPHDAFAAAKMDEWLFWEQYSHEPYIAVCRFQMVYLGKPASDLDPDKIKRGYAALARMEQQLAAMPFLAGENFNLSRRRVARLYEAGA